MNATQFENQANKLQLDNNDIEIKYQSKIPKKILGLCYNFPKGTFFDGDFCRKISLKEILEPIEYFNVDFPKHRLIPVFDCGDNDFIVYRISDGKWLKFNIVDELSFCESDDWKTLI